MACAVDAPKSDYIACEWSRWLFFFSSRRRHTRFDCDWSSDVCSSDLVVTFARTHLQEGMDSVKAAWEAGTGRLRPVIMTATAMIIGMLPMALGLGEGGEQNAPLGRAVIGGLMLATVAALLFVPVVFSLFHRQAAGNAKAEPKENVPSTVLEEAASAT